MKAFVLGTRGSDLALAQTRAVALHLQAAHRDLVVTERVIRTTGDARLDVPLSAPGALDKGLFTKELEEALLRGEIDAAVHSLKDLPTETPARLALGAILEREDPGDVLVSRSPGGIDALPAGARVATSSLRRKYFLQFHRPDLRIVEIRGNVPTRIRKLGETPDLAGIVLASAGLRRLQAAHCPLALADLQVTSLPFMLPAPGQGAIAVECRADDLDSHFVLAPIHDRATATSVTAERAVLSGLGGGCHSPVGVRAEVRPDSSLEIQAAWFTGEEPNPRRAEARGPIADWTQLVGQVTRKLLRAGD